MITVIAIDGPTASGKGTVAGRVAEALGFSYLDSGALYRLTALAAIQKGVELNDALTALVDLQHGFLKAPGLVADGRDMGTVIFPQAQLKIFLTASVEARAERRYKQLIGKGFSANMTALLQDLRERDERDTQRSVAPLKPAEGAKVLDTSALTVAEAVAQVLAWYKEASTTK